MGYNLIIGNLKVDYDNDEDCPNIRLWAEGVHDEKAPSFGEPTDCTNSRDPSYSAWTEFTKFVGLYDLFYGGRYQQGQTPTRDDGLLTEHAGCVPLTERHRREINAAFEAFKIKYPNAKPTYGNATDWEDDPENPSENAWMCRLVWLHYWVNWALDNCEKPVFANS